MCKVAEKLNQKRAMCMRYENWNQNENPSSSYLATVAFLTGRRRKRIIIIIIITRWLQSLVTVNDRSRWDTLMATLSQDVQLYWKAMTCYNLMTFCQSIAEIPAREIQLQTGTATERQLVDDVCHQVQRTGQDCWKSCKSVTDINTMMPENFMQFSQVTTKIRWLILRSWGSIAIVWSKVRGYIVLMHIL